ncbi:phosphotransferase family protein [Mycolicibacterium sp.]|uniref:phosphotransferase family protein n=1 Tax=Mycolicibacterium sp. TaxID=2320850 RepID=UPI001D7F2A91|nr:phosphotransferase family protein [Mycolicibacterium sp.]MCB1291555.1 phosphotransferase family protein [Mycobacterium sp.]MCB9408985.1 phosphotransferase family protein [Mycolicibacterium sp.]
MSTQGLGEGPIGDVSEITGGTQNIMLRFTRAGREYVFRRGPRHLRPVSNTVILRETQVLRALADTDVPHPRLIAVCEDTSVLGDAVFYLMEPIAGFNAGAGLPALHAGDADIRHGMGLSMADAAARLGAVDHEAVGLGAFGKPAGFLERQVPRWLSELESYSKFDNYPGPDIGDVDAVAAWLREHQPPEFRPGIMHGDYHAANVMFSPDGPDVVAIVDWEMCTIGDPLQDLGWMLATWYRPGHEPVLPNQLMSAGGLATPGELIERYATSTDRDLSQIDWYAVLACFKLGIILEGSHARAAAGLAPREVGDVLHTATVRLFDRARAIMDGE